MSGSRDLDQQVEMYEDVADELRFTLQNVLDGHEHLNKRAIDLVKIDLLSVSVIVAGISISDIQISLVLLAGFVAFLYSIWACARVYEPRNFKRGFGKEAAMNMHQDIQSYISEIDRSQKVVAGYADSVSKARDQYDIEKDLFDRGLWSSVAAILFFAFAAGDHLSGGFPLGFEAALLIIVPIIALWGRHKPIDESE